ncbi:MAG: SUMF1/EgtB/PvdO family nonheme iron enzyme, partial [Planctomycetota bacterium]
MKKKIFIFTSLIFMAMSLAVAQMPTDEEYTNSIGMKFVRIKPGTFKMGQTGLLPYEILPHTGGRGERMDTLRPGDFDEKPVHTVKITKPFYMAVFEVTNFQYELFDY